MLALTGSPFVAVLHVEVCVDWIDSIHPNSMNTIDLGLDVTATSTLAAVV